MQRLITRLAVLPFIFALAAPAQATFITVDFPGSSSTTTAAGGMYFWNPRHRVSETFATPGLNSATMLDLALEVDRNVLNRRGFVDFDVLLNDTLVGDFTVTRRDRTGLFSYSFSFPEIVGAGMFNLALQVTNRVPRGHGSIRFAKYGSTAIIAQVPEPATLGLLGLGLLGLAFNRWRNAT